LQTSGRPTPRTLVLTLAASLAFAHASVAQDTTASQDNRVSEADSTSALENLTPAQKALAEDFYRAEFVIYERKIEPDAINEKMAGRLPQPPNLEAERILRHTDETGSARTNMKLVPRKELHLASAAERLENSGRYRVLLAEGWYQAFPPDFKGKPMWVTAGEWLPDAGHTDVQGMITIDRQRYLHVNVRLNHWLPASARDSLLGIDLNAETPSRPAPPKIPIEPAGKKPPAGIPTASETATATTTDNSAGAIAPENAGGPERELVAGLNWPRAELLTWIQETRRMRSEEVHLLDSPTIGVLIFFKKIEPEAAAPMILELGLTGEKANPEDGQTPPVSS
jgi:peptidoglycan-binding protein CsiV